MPVCLSTHELTLVDVKQLTHAHTTHIKQIMHVLLTEVQTGGGRCAEAACLCVLPHPHWSTKIILKTGYINRFGASNLKNHHLPLERHGSYSRMAAFMDAAYLLGEKHLRQLMRKRMKGECAHSFCFDPSFFWDLWWRPFFNKWVLRRGFVQLLQDLLWCSCSVRHKTKKQNIQTRLIWLD